MVLIGGEEVPAYAGKLYLADVTACGECNPDLHKQVILEVIDKEQPDMIVFCHSSYGLGPCSACCLCPESGPGFGGR